MSLFVPFYFYTLRKKYTLQGIIPIELDKSVGNNHIFNKITSLSIHRFEIFKFAIFNDDPPDYISDADVLELLDGQIPKLGEYNRTYIGIEGRQILSYASEEKSIKISELIGAGVGDMVSWEF